MNKYFDFKELKKEVDTSDEFVDFDSDDGDWLIPTIYKVDVDRFQDYLKWKFKSHYLESPNLNENQSMLLTYSEVLQTLRIDIRYLSSICTSRNLDVRDSSHMHMNLSTHDGPIAENCFWIRYRDLDRLLTILYEIAS